MKHFFNRAVILLVVGAMTSITALAMTTNRQVTFSRDVTVNGSPVKAGTYKATFDDQTGEFRLLRGKKVMAQATARLEKISGPFRSGYSLIAPANGENHALVSIDMNKTNQAVIVNDGAGMKVVTP
ncbi:MAG TPA: hypothetical protein VF736_21725 [Pyrinomonadaceae bacterium]|jgi:hypothetical protein